MRIQKITPCSSFVRNFYDPKQFERELTSYLSYYKPSRVKVVEHGLKKLEEAYAKDLEIHNSNLEALESNKNLVQEIKTFMSEVGIPSTYSAPDPKSRARYTKSLTHSAGYLTDITRNISTSDGFSPAAYDILRDKWKKFLEEAIAAEKYEAEKAARDKAEATKKKKSDMELALLLVKYNLTPEDDWSDIYDEILERDKYLDLGYAMLETRNNWNDGFYKVENAISRFKIESDMDTEIEEDITRCLESEETDGRIFRDTKWSYSSLFNAADSDLYNDAEKVREHLDRD